MRLILQLFIICVIAAGVGLGLTALAVRSPLAIDVIEDHPWVAVATEGAPEVDAYALAALAHRGEAPLSVSDGLTFRAHEDNEGNPLSGSCTYNISGTLPPVRVWSLAAFDANGGHFANASHRYGYSSADATRDGAGAVRIALSPKVMSGDWIPVTAGSEIVLVLRLYDTTAAAIAGGRSAPDLPSVQLVECTR